MTIMTTRFFALLLAGTLGAVLLVGCDRHGGRGNDGDDDDVAGGDGDADADVEGRGDYPRGPYGSLTGDILQNFILDGPEGPISMNDLRQNPNDKLMLIYGGSPTCGWCETEGPEVEQAHAEHGAAGFMPFGVQMDNGATAADATAFFTQHHHAQYRYAATSNEFGMAWAVNMSIALPVNVFVNLETMQIIERIDGYPNAGAGGIIPVIESHLAQF
jgi:hypothetical protein